VHEFKRINQVRPTLLNLLDGCKVILCGTLKSKVRQDFENIIFKIYLNAYLIFQHDYVTVR